MSRTSADAFSSFVPSQVLIEEPRPIENPSYGDDVVDDHKAFCGGKKELYAIKNQKELDRLNLF